MKKNNNTQTIGKWEWSTGDPHKRNYGVYSIEGGRIAEILNQNSANAQLIAAAPDLLEACKEAFDLIDFARQYFPKSIKNNAKFKLENTCATIGKAIPKAEKEA